MKRKVFYQLVPHARSRDAVGRMAIELDKLARRSGFKSLIFTEGQQSLLPTGPLRRGARLATPAWAGARPPDVSLYHHSIGTKVADRFLDWPSPRRLLVYHNITPPALLESFDASAAAASRHGLSQLDPLIGGSFAQVGLSATSCADLKTHGAHRPIQIPFLLERFRRRLPLTAKSRDPRVLIVGRVARHKRVLEGIEAFAELKKRQPKAKLFVVGGLRGDDRYFDILRERIARPDLTGSVKLTGKISRLSLNYLYSTANALLTLSAHEGFCVPVVEAMQFGVPIVAFAGTALPETIGQGGLFVDTVDPTHVADQLQRVIVDSTLVDQLRRAQLDRLDAFDPRVVGPRYLELLR
jgi:glycosyltransferase involved in cell wall biosynthesis